MATAIIGTLKHLPKASILPTLPETGRPNRIYFIPNEDPTEDNRYNEYLWVKDETYPDGHWELVGPTTIDLTDYATLKNTDRTRARYNLALSFCIYNKYLICACKVIYLLYCMGVKFYITLHCLIIS